MEDTGYKDAGWQACKGKAESTGDRESECHGGSLTYLAFCANLPPLSLHEVLGDGKPEAGPS